MPCSVRCFPFFLLRLLRLPVGEACFSLSLRRIRPARADDSALLRCAERRHARRRTPMLLTLSRENRRPKRRPVLPDFRCDADAQRLSVCRRHMQSILTPAAPLCLSPLAVLRRERLSARRAVPVCRRAFNAVRHALRRRAYAPFPRGVSPAAGSLPPAQTCCSRIWALGISFKAFIRFSARSAQGCCFCSACRFIRRQDYPTGITVPRAAGRLLQCAFQLFQDCPCRLRSRPHRFPARG